MKLIEVLDAMEFYKDEEDSGNDAIASIIWDNLDEAIVLKSVVAKRVLSKEILMSEVETLEALENKVLSIWITRDDE